MKDGGGASYSVVSGKKVTLSLLLNRCHFRLQHRDVVPTEACMRGMQIKMKVEQSREDKILAQKRQKLLAFLNSSVE